MDRYKLKDKITVSDEVVKDLINRGWQEVNYINSQLKNIEFGKENQKLMNLLKNLLTSHYVFIGGLEAIVDGELEAEPETVKQEIDEYNEPAKELTQTEPHVELESTVENETNYSGSEVLADDSYDHEPFEYFVDFDDPVGEAITDDDLYN